MNKKVIKTKIKKIAKKVVNAPVKLVKRAIAIERGMQKAKEDKAKKAVKDWRQY